MSGYIVKVTLEHARPPVWRRIILPARITFKDLHKILQAAFGWDDEHLHDFTFSESEERIGSNEHTEEYEEDEKNIKINDYIHSCRWIRYTYDFGDDWQHKIVFEREDFTYHKLTAEILKAKGDNFAKDSGGIWAEERTPFDINSANAELGRMRLSCHRIEDGWSQDILAEKCEEWESFRNAYAEEEKRGSYADNVILTDLVRGRNFGMNEILKGREVNRLCSIFSLPEQNGDKIQAEKAYIRALQKNP